MAALSPHFPWHWSLPLHCLEGLLLQWTTPRSPGAGQLVFPDNCKSWHQNPDWCKGIKLLPSWKSSFLLVLHKRRVRGAGSFHWRADPVWVPSRAPWLSTPLRGYVTPLPLGPRCFTASIESFRSPTSCSFVELVQNPGAQHSEAPSYNSPSTIKPHYVLYCLENFSSKCSSRT